MARNLAVADIFSGCGGLSEGFRVAGFEPVFAIDNDKNSADSYRLNFKCKVICGDIRNASFEGVHATALVGGPPCQPFSRLMKNGSRDERRALTTEFIRAVEEIEPRVFLIENVPDYLKSSEALKAIKELRRMGYYTIAGILNAYHYGVPQNRKRSFIVGSRTGLPYLPRPLKWRFVVRDAFRGLPLRTNGRNWHIERNVTELSRKRYRSVKVPGGNRSDLPQELRPLCWRKAPMGNRDVFGRLWWDRQSVTIRTEFIKPEKGRYLHPNEHRPITIREGARLQTFPDDFRLVGSMTSIARQIGNAVPPQMGFVLALALRDHLENGRMGGKGEKVYRELPIPQDELIPFIKSRIRPVLHKTPLE